MLNGTRNHFYETGCLFSAVFLHISLFLFFRRGGGGNGGHGKTIHSPIASSGAIVTISWIWTADILNFFAKQNLQ